MADSTDIKVKCGELIKGEDLIAVSIDKDLSQPDMCVLTVRNPNGHWAMDAKLGDDVVVELGDPAEKVFTGEVFALEPAYQTGGSIMVIRAFNRLRRLLVEKKSRTFQKKSYQDIVGSVAGDHSLSPKCGSKNKVKHEHVYQRNQCDLEFLRQCAARIGYEVWVEDKTLYFDERKVDQDSGIEVQLGKVQEGIVQLLDFAPRMSVASVAKKVTVHGWDPDKKEAIVGEAELKGSKLGAKHAAAAAGQLASIIHKVDQPIFSVEEAKAIAESILQDMAMSFIEGEGACRGNTKLKPGIVVKITANDEHKEDPFNGKYFINGVTHQYKPGGGAGGGYTTAIRVRRDAQT